jgi:Raf kinase inhibitor-like YbhB/YbcL family protein
MGFVLKSAAFNQNDLIPVQYTCDGKDISPPLVWSGAPANTKSFALIMDDPDAPMGTWDHWILFNIPATTNELPENIHTLPEGTKVGKNSWKRDDWGGPCPPDRIHRYFFRLYALDTVLNLKEGVTKGVVLEAMQGHILATAELMGKYDRVK